jgi:hypothetical protein
MVGIISEFYDAALKTGTQVKFGKKLAKIDPSYPRVHLEDGSVIEI